MTWKVLGAFLRPKCVQYLYFPNLCQKVVCDPWSYLPLSPDETPWLGQAWREIAPDLTLQSPSVAMACRKGHSQFQSLITCNHQQYQLTYLSSLLEGDYTISYHSLLLCHHPISCPVLPCTLREYELGQCKLETRYV